LFNTNIPEIFTEPGRWGTAWLTQKPGGRLWSSEQEMVDATHSKASLPNWFEEYLEDTVQDTWWFV
jgi:hypothetical protein